MKVLSQAAGYALIFDSVKDLENVVNNLSKQLEWIKVEGVPTPYIYFTFEDTAATPASAERITEDLKERFK